MWRTTFTLRRWRPTYIVIAGLRVNPAWSTTHKSCSPSSSNSMCEGRSSSWDGWRRGILNWCETLLRAAMKSPATVFLTGSSMSSRRRSFTRRRCGRSTCSRILPGLGSRDIARRAIPSYASLSGPSIFWWNSDSSTIRVFFPCATIAMAFRTPNGLRTECPRRRENPSSSGRWRRRGFLDAGSPSREADTLDCCHIGCPAGDWHPSTDASCDLSSSTCTHGKSIRRNRACQQAGYRGFVITRTSGNVRSGCGACLASSGSAPRETVLSNSACFLERVSLPPNERRFTPVVLDRDFARPGFDRIAGAAVSADPTMRDDIGGQKAPGGNAQLPGGDTPQGARLDLNLLPGAESEPRGEKAIAEKRNELKGHHAGAVARGDRIRNDFRKRRELVIVGSERHHPHRPFGIRSGIKREFLESLGPPAAVYRHEHPGLVHPKSGKCFRELLTEVLRPEVERDAARHALCPHTIFRPAKGRGGQLHQLETDARCGSTRLKNARAVP